MFSYFSRLCEGEVAEIVIKVKEGYKMTELGEIPNCWRLNRLCDITEINPKKEVIEDDKDVSFIAMEDVSNQGAIIKRNVRKYGEVKKGYTAFKNNDVLLAKITPCFENGKKAIATQLINEIGFGSTEFHVLRAQKTEIIPSYIYYTISTNSFIQQAMSNMTGSAGQRRVPTGFLKEYIIATPPLKEQQKISLILYSVDEKIENIDNLIERTKELKKGLMQKLLTKGIGHDRFKRTEIGRIPENWKVDKIKDLSFFCSNGFVGTASPFYTDDNEGTPYLMSNNVRANKIDERNVVRIRKEFKQQYPRSTIFEGDMLTVQSGHIGTSCIVPQCYNNTNCHALIITRFNKAEIVPLFISYYINSTFGLSRLSKIFVGTTIKHVNVKDLIQFYVPVPPLSEQKQIALILSSVDEKIDQYEAKKEKLQQLKKGLMQSLLRGHIRVQ